MINGLGVVGWGVGGIEAEAVMLGQPMYMLIPEVVGVELTGRAARGRDGDRPRAARDGAAARPRRRRASSSSSTAPALDDMPLANRATIANMAPEYGATIGLLPGRRADARLPRAERARRGRSSPPSSSTRSSRASGATRPRTPVYSESLRLDLGSIVPSLAGPRRPQDRVALARHEARVARRRSRRASARRQPRGLRRRRASARRRALPAPARTASVVIAAIT